MESLEMARQEEGARLGVETTLLPIGDLIDLFVSRKNEYEAASKAAKMLKEDMDALEYRILTAMEDAGVERTGTARATVTRKVDLHGKVTDMDAFMAWCVENHRPDMIQKRISDPAFREVFEQTGEYPPGTDGYTEAKVTITRRK